MGTMGFGGEVSSVAGTADAPFEGGPDAAMARQIAGVRIERVTALHDARGAMVPFLDFGAPFWEEPIVYGYQYTIRPGRIKGWGMHRRQTDRYFVMAGDLRVVLHDGREGSATAGAFCQFYFTDASPGLLRIPVGVWHATQNWGESLGRVVNFPTHRYDPSQPDKVRIDPHSGSIKFNWRLNDG
jgi:dTDP-4-dehydrorhamnose 3,5-epimerase